MKLKFVGIFFPVLMCALSVSANVSGTQPSNRLNINDASYAYGYAMATQHLTLNGKGISIKDFWQGMQDYIDGKKARTSGEDQLKLVEYYQSTLNEIKADQLRADSAGLLAKSQEFLAKNAQQKGVHVNEEGIQYRVIKSGDGRASTEQDVIKFNVSMKTLSGQDSRPTTETAIKANAFKKGWMSLLKGHKIGSELEIFVPPRPELFNRGIAAKTEASDVIIYDVKILDIYPYEQSKNS